MTASASRRRSRTAGLVFAWALAALLVIAVLAAGWIAVRGALAYGHLRAAEDRAGSVAAELRDPAVASRTISAIAGETGQARALTSDPIWRMAEGLPWIGPQLAGVSTVIAAVDDVAGSALSPLAEVAASFSVDAIRPRDGLIDVAPFEALRPAAESGAEGIARAWERVHRVDADGLLPPLRDAVERARTLLTDARDGAGSLARATELMPPMLGADGPRNYLVVFQNNAEWRSLGGIVGAMALIHTDGGRLSLAAQASSSDFRRYDDSVIALPDDVFGVFGRRPGLWVQNTTQVTDFALAGPLVREMWARQTGVQVDGVISFDPVALSYLLEATGPIDLPAGDVLSSDNAAALLLNDVYQRYERPADQDAFFESAAAAVFDALSAGAADPAVLLEALTRAGEERRLFLWSAHADEQAVLDGTTLQGGLPTTDAEHTGFGVYLNDATGSKMDYYMAAGATAARCDDPAGSPTTALSVTLRSDAPADAAALPDYITGGGAFGVAPGVTRTVAYVYLPTGAELLTVDVSGAADPAAGFGGGVHEGRQVLTWTTDLAPGQETRLDVRVSTPSTPGFEIVMTPIINRIDMSGLASPCHSPR